ncbi:hypothetical protein TNCV_4204991 [Trichonephila clavipes]|nr:hypothetical protein TNCV_4204991 [Trichonephila clavipes]
MCKGLNSSPWLSLVVKSRWLLKRHSRYLTVVQNVKIHRVERLKHVKSLEAQSPHLGEMWKFDEGVLAQVSSSSSDHGSNYDVRHQLPSCCLIV